ncbi:hypothetical protein K1719_020177 [Acacia pycnantha]|nr:hypothetical protein K1719_020177 [Acacia pycnantha]
MKIWMGKRKLNENDSDDSDEDGSEDEAENEKSTVLNNGNDSDSNKAEVSSGSVTGGLKSDGGDGDNTKGHKMEMVDVDELKSVAEEWGVEAMPTFLFLKEGKLVDKVVGAKNEELQLTISKHATVDA